MVVSWGVKVSVCAQLHTLKCQNIFFIFFYEYNQFWGLKTYIHQNVTIFGLWLFKWYHKVAQNVNHLCHQSVFQNTCGIYHRNSTARIK